MRRSAMLAVVVTLATAASATAQERTIEVAIGMIRTRGEIAGAAEVVRGAAVAVGARAWWGQIGAAVRYVGGTAGNTAAGWADRDIADARVQGAYRIHPLLAIRAGVHARVQTSDAGTRRLVFWEVGIRSDISLSASLGAYGEVWLAPVGSSNMSRAFGAGRGGEVGLAIAIPRTGIRLSISYRMDRGSGDDPAYAEAAETLLAGVQLGLP